jgi:SAM-dependent methyltransferase
VLPWRVANEEQIRVWNEVNALRWLKLREPMVRPLAPFGEAAIAALDPRPGESALDVGCGFGDTTLALAKRTGRAMGIDVCEPFIRTAQAEAAHGARYLLADAQTHPFADGTRERGALEAPFDLCYSRFGLMFFSDPAAAFANLHAAMRTGGRFAAVAWGTWQENEWVTMPLAAARRHAMVPDPSSGPGPFALGDPLFFEELLRRAGFRNTAIRRLELPFDADAAQLMEQGPAAAFLRTSNAGEELRAKVREDLASALGGRKPGAVVLLATAAS